LSKKTCNRRFARAHATGQPDALAHLDAGGYECRVLSLEMAERSTLNRA
jgi:hypothetical protein